MTSIFVFDVVSVIVAVVFAAVFPLNEIKQNNDRTQSTYKWAQDLWRNWSYNIFANYDDALTGQHQ